MAVDDNCACLERVERALQRFGSDYRVRGEITVEGLFETLERAERDDEPPYSTSSDPSLGPRTRS